LVLGSTPRGATKKSLGNQEFTAASNGGVFVSSPCCDQNVTVKRTAGYGTEIVGQVRDLFSDVDYADELGVTNTWRLTGEKEMSKKDEDQKGQAPAKPAASKPAMKQPRWPGLGGNAGGTNGKSVFSRAPTGRGAARGR
jgi:hypothetical protein